MKKIISHIITFVLIILLALIISFISIEINLRDSILLNQLDKIDYYNNTYNNINKKIKENIINEEIKKDYQEYINISIIKKDIKNIISNKEYNISHYDNFYNIINKYTTDKEICNKYSKIIDNIYINNIFPIYEYKILNKLYINTTDVIISSLIVFSIIIFLEFILFIINKKLTYNIISLLSSSILLTFPYIFLKITNIFKNFIYTNTHYTKFLLSIVNNIKNSLFIYGISVILIILLAKLLKHRN